MRSFEERKAEIFLRRDKLVKIKKRNKKVTLSLCTVLFVCAAVFSVSFLPQFLVPKSQNNADGNDEYSYLLGNVAYDIVSVENENGVKFETTADIEKICSLMFGDVLSDDAITDAAGATDSGIEVGNSSHKKNGIRFTITDNKGRKTVYLLSDNKLINESENSYKFLSKQEADELKKALGSEYP